MVLCVLVLMQSATAADDDNDGLDDLEEQQLAETYAPKLFFERSEELFPVAVDYHLANANLNRSDGTTSTMITAAPTATSLGAYSADTYYLDNRMGTVDDRYIVDDYAVYAESHTPVVYAHVSPAGNGTVVQYWLFYAFNTGTLNIHEGDWEMVQVMLDGAGEPVEAMYSQHLHGQRASWSQVDRSGMHPHVYVARGSHANYFRSYQGLLGLASDHVGKNGETLTPEDYDLVLLGEAGAGNHVAGQNWLDYGGRWGDYGAPDDEVRGKRGPPGPAFRDNGDMWAGVAWGKSLPSLSSMMLTFDWIFYHFTVIFLAVFALAVAAAAVVIYRRHRREGLHPPYTSLLRIDGMNMRSIGNLLAIAGIIVGVAALFFPWYTVAADIDAGSYSTSGTVDIVSIDGVDGLQVNLLEENSGMIQIGAIPVAFSLIVGAGILLFILGTIGAGQRRVGRRYISRAVRFWIPVVLILVAVVMLQSLAFYIEDAGVPQDTSGDIEEILSTLSSQPLGGTTTLSLPEYGVVHLDWGLGAGLLLLILAGVLLLAAGILHFRAPKQGDHVS
ncbi:MAG: Vps62-related protein [Thermoplasmatota archaeon]